MALLLTIHAVCAFDDLSEHRTELAVRCRLAYDPAPRTKLGLELRILAGFEALSNLQRTTLESNYATDVHSANAPSTQMRRWYTLDHDLCEL